MMLYSSSRQILIGTYGLMGVVAGVVFVLDLMVPRGLAGGLPYLVVVLLSLRIENPHSPLWAAMGCSMLILLGFFFSSSVEEWGHSGIIRTWALMAIWTTAFFSRVYMHHDRTIMEEESHFPLTERVFELSPDHMSLIGSDYRYRRVNRAFRAVHRPSHDQFIGTHVSNVWSTDVFEARIKPYLERTFLGEEIHDEAWLPFQDGKSRYMAVSYFPLPTPGQRAREILVIERDLTARKQAEDLLFGSENRLRTILDSLPNFVGIGTAEGIVMDCNLAPLQMAGVKREDVIGKSFVHTYWVNYSSNVQDQVQQIIQRVAQGETIRNDIQARMGDNLIITVDAWFIPIRDASGEVIQIVLSGVDVTARRRAEHAFQKSQQDFQNLVDSLEGIVWECDFPTYQFTFVSRQAERLLGFPIERWMAEPNFFCNQLYNTDQQWVIDYCREATLRKENHEIEYRFHCANGEVVWLRDLITVVVEHDEPVKLRGVMFNITHRKQAEEDLRQSEIRFRTYFETGLVGMAILSVDKTWLEVNDRMCDILGLSREELRLYTWTQLTHPDDLSNDESQFRLLLVDNLESYSIDKRFVRRDGHIVYTKLYVNGVRNSEGQVEYATAMVQDISHQKIAEDAVRSSERLALATMNALSACICVLDETGRILMVNDGWKQFAQDHGASPVHIGLGQNYFTFWDQVSGRSREEIKSVAAEFLSVLNGEKIEYSYEYQSDASPTLQWFTCRVTRFPGSGPLRVVVAHQNITEQKQVQNALQASESTLKTFYESAPMMMGIIELVNRDIRHLSDNKAAGEFFNLLPPASRFKCLASTRGVPSDIIEFWIERYQESQRLGRPLKFEYAHPKNGISRWLSATVTPIGLPTFDHPRFAYIVEDITDRKLLEDTIRTHAEELEAEVERRAQRIYELEQRRMQVEKLAALAQVAAGIAHEINNPLASIAQSMVILKRALPDTHPKYKYTHKIMECIDRITHIIQQLYKLYRPEPSLQASIDIRTVVQSSLEIMTPFAKQRGVTLTCTFPEHPVSASLTRTDLIQVLCNLIQNALDASSPNSNVELSVTRQHGTLTIGVVDEGEGIPPDISSHIFEPFFTTKQGTVKGGMGLGLAVSRSLVESMGATLNFSSIAGSGTSFRIIFPEAAKVDSLESV